MAFLRENTDGALLMKSFECEPETKLTRAVTCSLISQREVRASSPEPRGIRRIECLHRFLETLLVNRHFHRDVGQVLVDFRVGFGADGGIVLRVLVVLRDWPEAGMRRNKSIKLHRPQQEPEDVHHEQRCYDL